MRWRIVRTIWAKELTETLRDRRTLFAMFVLPVLIHPLLFMAMGRLTAAESAERRKHEPQVAVWGPVPEAVQAALEREVGAKIVERRERAPAELLEAARALVGNKTVELVLVAGEDAAERLGADGSARVEVYYDSVKRRSDGAQARVKKALQAFSDAQVVERVARRGLPEGFQAPLAVSTTDVASKRQRGAGIAGAALPIIMLFVMMMCGLLPAIDLTAGEKERGTLQTLLCAPVKPTEIVAGKYLTVVITALVGAAANLAAMAFALSRHLAAMSDDLELSLPWPTALGLFVAILPTAFFLSALLLVMSVFARSFREAQSYLTPMMFVILAPAMVILVPGVELSAPTALVPIANMALLTRALLEGTAGARLFFIVTVANCAYAVAAVLLTARVFETEQVLLSGERPWRDVFGRRGRTQVTPSPRSAVMFAIVLLVVAYYGALWVGAKRLGLAETLVVLQVGLMLVPALAWAALERVSFKETFSLKLPGARGLLGAILLAAGGWALGDLLAAGLLKHFAGARAYAEELKRLFGGAGVAVTLAATFLPAVAEEACFRGVVLSGLANTGSRVVAIGGSALAFGLMHFDPFHVITATAMGLLMGFATLESGSIFAGALLHLVNNGLRMLALHVPAVETLMSRPITLAAGCACAVLGLALLWRSRRA